MTNADAVLETWFGDDLEDPQTVVDLCLNWFAPDSSFDDLIRDRFAALPDRARDGEFSDWIRDARSTLALVLVLDQFPRNLYRGTPRSFAYDSAALGTSREALAREVDADLHPVEAIFLYLPFEHAEDRELQAQSVALFRSLADRAPAQLADRFAGFVEYAERHQAVIERFGRFPHRNSILGRPSTPEERSYLESGGETFSGTK